MDSVLGISHSKRGAINEEKIGALKFDLDLVRTKRHERRLSFTPGLYALRQHMPNLLFEFSRPHGTEEDTMD